MWSLLCLQISISRLSIMNLSSRRPASIIAEIKNLTDLIRSSDFSWGMRNYQPSPAIQSRVFPVTCPDASNSNEWMNSIETRWNRYFSLTVQFWFPCADRTQTHQTVVYCVSKQRNPQQLWLAPFHISLSLTPPTTLASALWAWFCWVIADC